jgi:hypothetical protein
MVRFASNNASISSPSGAPTAARESETAMIL